MFGPDRAQAGPLRSKRVTNEQVRIGARWAAAVEVRHRVRDNIADGILALHDLDHPKLVGPGDGHGEHHSIGHIQTLADSHHLASGFIAELARHPGRCRDQEEKGGQRALEPPRSGRQQKSNRHRTPQRSTG